MICQRCGGLMVRTGTCFTCTSCGDSTGCGKALIRFISSLLGWERSVPRCCGTCGAILGPGGGPRGAEEAAVDPEPASTVINGDGCSIEDLYFELALD